MPDKANQPPEMFSPAELRAARADVARRGKLRIAGVMVAFFAVAFVAYFSPSRSSRIS